jgi:uncharacterized protein YbjT (DUF2867 family)
MIFVTGATGNIGSEIVRQLVALGEPVRVLSRDRERAARQLGPGVEVVEGELSRTADLPGWLQGVDRLFLMAHAQELAALAGPVIEAARAAGVQRVVLNSSSTVQFEPPVEIGRWHAAAEALLEASGLEWTMLRPGNFASNALRWAPMIRSQQAVFAPQGGRSAPIDPRDIASVAVKALTTPGHVGKKYVLTGEQLMTAQEQVGILGKVLGQSLRFVPVPDAAARAGMIKGGMTEEMADAVLELLRPHSGEGLMTRTVREVTGREPRTFEQWARDNIEAFR